MILEELIDSAPANAGRTDQEVLDWLDETVSQWVDIPWLEFQIWRHAEGVTNAMLETVAAGVDSTRATAAQYMLDVVSAGQPFSASDPRVRTLIVDAALPAGMMASLQALAQVSVPRWLTQTEHADMDSASKLYWIGEARA